MFRSFRADSSPTLCILNNWRTLLENCFQVTLNLQLIIGEFSVSNFCPYFRLRTYAQGASFSAGALLGAGDGAFSAGQFCLSPGTVNGSSFPDQVFMVDFLAHDFLTM